MVPPDLPSAVQVVGYERDVGAGASLLLATDAGVRSIPLAAGRQLQFGLGTRHCAGTVGSDGHTPCPSPSAPYCEQHLDTWVCARCRGTCLKDEMDCYQRHAVYLAAFAPATFKVGVTRRSRLQTRLREQGADRGACIRTVGNGRLARELETKIAEEVGDRVQVATKIEGLGRCVDAAAWSRLLEDYEVQDTLRLEYDLDLATPPTPETVARGHVRGTKGRIVVIERDGGTYAVDMRDLVGYDLQPGGETGERQANLGAFSG